MDSLTVDVKQNQQQDGTAVNPSSTIVADHTRLNQHGSAGRPLPLQFAALTPAYLEGENHDTALRVYQVLEAERETAVNGLNTFQNVTM